MRSLMHYRRISGPVRVAKLIEEFGAMIIEQLGVHAVFPSSSRRGARAAGGVV
jgi:hypothetical protein